MRQIGGQTIIIIEEKDFDSVPLMIGTSIDIILIPKKLYEEIWLTSELATVLIPCLKQNTGLILTV